MNKILHALSLTVSGAVIGILLAPLVTPFIPFLPGYFGNTPQAAPEPEEGVTITYRAPEPSEFDALDFPGYVPEENLAGTVDIPLPLTVVDQAYITAFNKLTNQGIQLEAQLKKNVYPAMLQVQAEAAAGNYLVMFERMTEAKAQIATMRAMTQTLAADTATFRASYERQTMTIGVRNASSQLTDTATALHTSTARLADLLDQTLKGSVPEQELLTEIDLLSEQIEGQIVTLVEHVRAVTDAIVAQM